MRNTLFTLVVFALASPVLAQTVDCTGTESTGNGIVDTSCTAGTRMYAYPVTDPNGNMTDVYIGTDDCEPLHYSAWCEPQGWTHTIEVGDDELHNTEKTQHGVVSTGSNGNCLCRIHWSAPALGPAGLPGGNFTFGFDSLQPSHDVGWTTIDGVGSVDEAWAEYVGAGTGPVHGPTTAIPAVSEWGLVVMLLLVVAAGTIVIRRRRAAVA